jgi:hypothetical protein
MPGFPTRMLMFDGKRALARQQGPRIIIQWDNGVAQQDFDSVDAAVTAQKALPAELSRKQLEHDGFTVDEAK